MGRGWLNKIYRERIKKGDYPICYLCCKPITKPKEVSQDHILPIACGGRSEYSNLAPVHKVCNSKRGTTPLSMIACGCWKSGWYFKQRD